MMLVSSCQQRYNIGTLSRVFLQRVPGAQQKGKARWHVLISRSASLSF